MNCCLCCECHCSARKGSLTLSWKRRRCGGQLATPSRIRWGCNNLKLTTGWRPDGRSIGHQPKAQIGGAEEIDDVAVAAPVRHLRQRREQRGVLADPLRR